MFALVLAIMLYFARRLTIDVVRPVEMLQLATDRLRAGSLDHRIELPTSTRSNEIEDLADAFNEMASALHASHGELARRAAYDGLTGLANRTSFNDRLERHVSTTERRSQSVSVLFSGETNSRSSPLTPPPRQPPPIRSRSARRPADPRRTQHRGQRHAARHA